MKKIFFLSCLTFLFNINSQAQKTCGADKLHEAQLKDPEYLKQVARAKAFADYYLKTHNNYTSKIVQNGTVAEVHIPVVFHVVHTGGAIGTIYNPSDADLIAVVNSLNLSFSNLFDQASVPGTFNSVNTPIRFDLAMRDPNCAATTGIDRIDLSSNSTYVASGVFADVIGISDNTLKTLVGWSTTDYYNIYVVNKIDGQDGTSGTYIAGYALLPNGLETSGNDGMVMLATQCNAASTTPTHEIGHALGLPHPFGSISTTGICPANSGNCLVDNDGICDTAPVEYDFTCNPSGNNPCTGVPWDGTQFNYMAYFGCTDRFTPIQVDTMLSNLYVLRSNLTTSLTIDPPPSSSPIAATCNTTVTNVGNLNAMGPVSVSIQDINNNTTSYSGDQLPIADYTCTRETNLYLNQTQTLEVITDNLNQQRTRAYIDYNNNGIFEVPAEQVLSTEASGTAAYFTHTATFTIPGTAVQNVPLRMRVISDFAGNPYPLPCATLGYGQAEDYKVTIFGAPLSIHWNYVLATPIDNKKVEVKWATTSEQDTKLFEVERSSDGINFYPIGTRASKSQNNSGRNYYSFMDNAPYGGSNYYRIKQIDLGLHESISNTSKATISVGNTIALQIAPNPTSNTMQFEINNPDTKATHTIQVIDLSGRVLNIKSALVAGKHSLDINNLAKGIYMVQILNQSGITAIQKLIVQ
jgi:hypothetical protein